MSRRPTPTAGLSLPFNWMAELARARQFRGVAWSMVDIENGQPAWPKYFMLGHAVELALKSCRSFAAERGSTPAGLVDPHNHDLLGLYDYARACGMGPVAVGEEEALRELHRIHSNYEARYPKELRGVWLASEFDDVVDAILAAATQATSLIHR